MSQNFSPEHYQTAERCGVDFGSEKYPDAEILAEVDLTLGVLLDEDSHVSLSREDLIAYHWLQYGGLRSAGGFAISLARTGEQGQFIRGDEARERLEPLQKVLAYVLGPDQLSQPLPLGRFQLNRDPIGSTQARTPMPESFLDAFQETAPIQPVAARNPGPFLYPRDDVRLTYHGTAKSDSDFGQAVFSELAEHNPPLVERCFPDINRDELAYPGMPVYLEELRVEREGSTDAFVAVSSDMILLSVEPAPAFDFLG